jgi:polysaccharide pyruvyl transferase WcaK-like protein
VKLLLAGGYDTCNLGDYAMLYVLKEGLEKSGSVKITLLSRHPEKPVDDFKDISLIKNLDFNTKKESIGKWFRGFNKGDDSSHLHRIYKELLEADALVIGGGRLLIDITLNFMRGPLFYYFILVLLAKFLGKPIIVYAMTIEKPFTEEGRNFLRFIIENASLVTLREVQSLETLRELCIDTTNVHVYPDPAFALPSVSDAEGKKIFLSENIPLGNCIGVNLRFSFVQTTFDSSDILRYFASFCDMLFEKFSLPIVFIPQMYYGIDNPYYDDRNLHKEVREMCRYKEAMYVLSGRYTLRQTLSIYKNIKALFSMRRHGVIFAATQGVPVYGVVSENNISYALDALNLEKNRIPFDPGKAMNISIFNTLTSFEITKEKIKKALPALSTEARKHVEAIKSFLKV